jgi:KUP system potassium uptake protein
MRDNKGQGGTLACRAYLAQDRVGRLRLDHGLAGRVRDLAVLRRLSMITPAISVLSAVDGLKVVQPAMAELVVPIALVLLVFLFVLQRRGRPRSAHCLRRSC